MLIALIPLLLIVAGVIFLCVTKKAHIVGITLIAVGMMIAVPIFETVFSSQSNSTFLQAEKKREKIIFVLETTSAPETAIRLFSENIESFNREVEKSRKWRENIFLNWFVNYDIGNLELINAENYLEQENKGENKNGKKNN